MKGADLVLLDEPLANLDYKLREELREELPRIFAGSPARLRLCDDRAVRGAAARRRDGDAVARAGSPSSARPPRSIRRPARPRHRAGLLRPAAEHDAGAIESGGACCSTGEVALPAPFAGLPDGRYTSASARTTLARAAAGRPIAPAGARSRSPRSPDRRASSTRCRRPAPGWRWRRACSGWSRARRSTL